MARSKKIPIDTLIRLIEEYYITECRNNPSKLKYSEIAKYICLKGHDIKDYDIRRSVEAVDLINSLKEKAIERTELSIYMFKSLDVDEFLKKNASIIALKQALVQRDQYYSEVVTSASFYLKNYISLEKNLCKLQDELSNCEQVNKDLNEKNIQLVEREKFLNEKINTLKSILETYVYPEIANNLLSKDGSLLINVSSDITSEHQNIIDENNITFDEVIAKNEKLKSSNTVIQGYFNKI